jgi:tetratricopeptide (TPR) repeat protein
VAVRLIGPDNRPVADVDRTVALIGHERIIIVAGATGDYRLEVRARDRGVAPGRYELRIEELREAAPYDTARAAGEKLFWEAERLRALSSPESFGEALKKYEEALRHWRDGQDRRGEADTLMAIGHAFASLGKNEQAVQCYTQAADLRRATADPQHEAYALLYSGARHSASGEKQKALDHLNRALALNRATGDRAGEAATLNLMGSTYGSLSEPQKALDYYNQSLSISRAFGQRQVEAQALANLALAYASLGESQKALDYYGRALPLLRAVGDRRSEARVLHNVCEVYLSLGEDQKAFDYCSQALPLHRAVGDRPGEAHTLNHLGEVYFSRGKIQEALRYEEEALRLWQSVRGRHAEAVTLNKLALIHSSLGQEGQAFGLYEKALEVALAASNRGAESGALAGIARLERDRGNLAKARSNIEAAMKIFETTRAKVPSQDLRASFFAPRRRHYEFYLDILLRQHEQNPSAGHNVTALEASERARARSLLELLAESEADLKQGIDPALERREREIQSRLSSIQGRLIQAQFKTTPDKTGVEALESELEKAEEERGRVEQEIRQKHPRYAEFHYPATLGLEAIRSLVSDETALLEYTLGKEGSFLFVVTREGVESHRLPNAPEIARLVEEMRIALSRPGRREFGRYVRVARQLYQWLIEPAAGALANKRSLTVVADGALHYLPFEGLLTKQPVAGSQPGYKDLDYLLERWAISYAPSASVLQSLRQNQAKTKSRSAGDELKKFVAFGDPLYEPGRNGGPGSKQNRGGARGLFDGKERRTLERLEDSGREVTLIGGLYQ